MMIENCNRKEQVIAQSGKPSGLPLNCSTGPAVKRKGITFTQHL